MTTYMPATTVLPEYTDEALHAEHLYKGDAAATLLRVPDVYRQAVEAEAWQRSHRITHNGGHAQAEPIADQHEVRCRVVAEVLAQLAAETA